MIRADNVRRKSSVPALGMWRIGWVAIWGFLANAFHTFRPPFFLSLATVAV
jgi:hypothetical protein